MPKIDTLPRHDAIDHVTCRDEVLPTCAVDGERCTLRLTPPDLKRPLYNVVW